MEVGRLEMLLAGGTKAVWNFSGRAACSCLELIREVIVPETGSRLRCRSRRRCRLPTLPGFRDFRPGGGAGN